MSKQFAFIFPGQGSQAQGMGKEFFENFAWARESFEEASEAIKIDMRSLLFDENKLLEETAYTQPAILLVSYVAQRAFKEEKGIEPSLAFGHSLGEFSALLCVGALTFRDAISLVHERGKLMQRACQNQEAGMMVVLGLEDESIEIVLDNARRIGKQVWAANFNNQGQIVLAGIKNDLLSLEGVLKEQGAKRSMVLAMSVASHCPLLNGITHEFSQLLEEAIKEPFSAPVVSNATMDLYSTKADALKLLTQQLISPVLYRQSIAKVDGLVNGYIEFGHGSVLKGLNKRLSSLPTFTISTPADCGAFDL